MFKKLSRGSILAFSLIIMGIVLAAALGIAAVSVTEQKNAGTTTKSTQSFQVANSGSEIVLKDVKNNPSKTLNDYGACASGSGTVSVGDAGITGGTTSVTFYTDDIGTTLPCGDPISNAVKIKSVGTYAGTTRAIEVALAAGCGTPGVVTGILEQNGDATFSQPKSDAINQFIEGGGVIASMLCEIPGIKYTLNPALVASRSELIALSIESNTQLRMICEIGGFNNSRCSIASSDIVNTFCSGGWSVIKFCN
ncbi:MAG: hypothetical protein WC608_04710 [Parcubacteria group bacterium]